MVEAVSNDVETTLRELQQNRISVRNDLTLIALFRGKSPYYLRATTDVVSCLVSRVYEYHLAQVDEQVFVGFLGIAVTDSMPAYDEDITSNDNSYQQLPSIEQHVPSRLRQMPNLGLFDLLAHRTMPFSAELCCAHERNLTRLTRQFYQQLCTDDAAIDWQRLAQFVSESNSVNASK